MGKLLVFITSVDLHGWLECSENKILNNKIFQPIQLRSETAQGKDASM